MYRHIVTTIIFFATIITAVEVRAQITVDVNFGNIYYAVSPLGVRIFGSDGFRGGVIRDDVGYYRNISYNRNGVALDGVSLSCRLYFVWPVGAGSSDDKKTNLSYDEFYSVLFVIFRKPGFLPIVKEFPLQETFSHAGYENGNAYMTIRSQATLKLPNWDNLDDPFGDNGGGGDDPDDVDGDGVPNDEDDDVDGDGVSNDEDDDVDGDGVPNDEDDDVDGDGVPNDEDDDVDGDGVSNDEDEDIDGDGVPNDEDEDVDGDGVPNGDDGDDDGDGIPDGDDTPDGPTDPGGDGGGGGDDPDDSGDPDDEPNNQCTCGACCSCECTCGNWSVMICSGTCWHYGHGDIPMPPEVSNEYCECHHDGGGGNDAGGDNEEDEEANPGSVTNPGALQAGNGTLGTLPNPNERPAAVQIPQRLKERFSKLRTDFESKTGLKTFKNLFQYRPGKMDKLCVSNPIREFNGVELPEMEACLDLDELASQSWVLLLRNVLLFMVICMFVGAIVVVLRQY